MEVTARQTRCSPSSPLAIRASETMSVPGENGETGMIPKLSSPSQAGSRHQGRRMGDHYLLLKLLHIFVAVVALGTSACLGIVLEFYADDATHGSFVLRAIER